MHLRRYKALLVHSDPLHHSHIFTFALMTTGAFSQNVGKVIIELQFDISNLFHLYKSQLQSHWMDRTCYQLHHIIDLKNKKTMFLQLIKGASCPDPIQLTREDQGLVQQVQILGLALEGRSDHWNHRAAFIGSENKYFSRTTQSDVMKFITHTDKFVIPYYQLQGFNTSAIPRIWTCDTRPFSLH